jgi:hypothetical protein
LKFNSNYRKQKSLIYNNQTLERLFIALLMLHSGSTPFLSEYQGAVLMARMEDMHPDRRLSCSAMRGSSLLPPAVREQFAVSLKDANVNVTLENFCDNRILQ